MSCPLAREDFLEAQGQPAATLQLRAVVEGQQTWVSRQLSMLTASEMGWGSEKCPPFPSARASSWSELLFHDKSADGYGDLLRALNFLPSQMSCSSQHE